MGRARSRLRRIPQWAGRRNVERRRGRLADRRSASRWAWRAATYAATHSIERAIQLGYVPFHVLVVEELAGPPPLALMSFVGLRFAMR